MSHPLFRKEVLQAKRVQWLGGISLAQPLPLRVLAIAAALTALAILVFLACAGYTRRSTVVGELVPARGLAVVLAPATGVVARLDVDEGERVRAGSELGVVAVPHATPARGDTLAALEERLQRRQDGLEIANRAQRELLTAQAQGLAAQLDASRRELAQIEAGIATRTAQARIARETLERLQQLQREQYVSALQAKQQQAAVLEQDASVQAMRRDAAVARRTIAQLEQALHELPGQRMAADAGFARDVATLEQERVETEARGNLSLRAPVSGLVAAQLVKPGQAVQAGQPILSLLPGDGRLEAQLLVPSRAIGFVSPGDRVLLRYQAFPYQKFGHALGRVARVGRSAIGGNGTAGMPDGRSGETFYRVTVALARQDVVAYGRPEQLRPGMLLEADILGERRRLFEWLLEPLYSLTGKVGDG